MNTSQKIRRELMLLRHAKSSWKQSEDDFERSITEGGELHAEQIGIWLKKHRIPDFVICSPAKRAIMTAEIVCQKLGLPVERIRIETELYNADLANILSVLASAPSNRQNILLVGHNPSIESAIEYLLTEPVKSDLAHGKLVLPATLVRIAINNHWNGIMPHAGELISITHGKLLSVAKA